MVGLVRDNAKKIDLKATNQLLFGFFLDLLGVRLQYKPRHLTSPNLMIPFDYNLLILVVEHAYMVCPTTFIVKILK